MTDMKRFSWGKWLLILLLLAGAGGGGWWWNSTRQKQDAPEFKTVAVARGDITQSVTANGQINAVKNVAVGTQVSGIITELKVDFNSRVTNGQVIAQIDPSTYDQNVTQAQAELANAKASEFLANINFKRAKELMDAKLIPRADYDKAEADLLQAQAVVQTRQAGLKRAQVDLERATIYSPIDGMVISRNVDVGQTVAASFSTPTLFSIANDLRNMRIEAMVSEADVGGIQEGQQVTFTVDAFPGRQFKGQVSQVRFAPITNQNVVNYISVVDVNNADLKLRPGMTANTSIITAQQPGVLRIPNAALRFRPPPGSVVAGETNAPGEKPKQEIATSGPFAGLPVPPWSKGERRRPTDEERASYESSLTPEQKQKYQEAMNAMRARFAQGEGGAGGSGGGERPKRSEQTGPRSQTIYVTEKEVTATGAERVMLKPVTVKIGISDGTNTEVLEGLKEGDVVVVGTVSSSTSAAAAPANPFSSPFGGPGRR
jgi:HlyD family secretion protein